MRRCLALGLLAVAIVGTARAASAHAGFVSSDPANGAVLAEPPAAVTVTFTEPLDPGLSTLTLTDAGGATVITGDPTVDGLTLTVPIVEPVGDGVYTANWRVVSTEDGHVTAGAFSFGVGDVVAPADGGSEVAAVGPTPLSVASKAALYAGLMLLVAIAVVGLGAFGGRPRAVRPLGVAGGALGFAGAVGILVAEQQAVGAPMADLAASETGRPFVLLVGFTLAAAGCAVLAAARPGWRRLFWLAGAVAAGAMFVRTTTGHPAAASLPLLQETLQWVHFLAAGIWIGGLVLLAALLREDPSPPAPPVRRFSSLAVVAVSVVVLTGLARALSQLGGPGEVLDALGGAYGRTLAVKVLLVVGLIALGARNRRRSIPRLAEGDPTALRRLVRAEIVVALGVILATATLTGLSPVSATPSVPTVPDPGTVTGSDFATTTRVELTVSPGTPGPNVFRALVLDYDSEEPATADEVTLRLRSVTRPDLAPVSVELTNDNDAWVGQGTDLSTAGTWSVTANVVSGADTVEIPLTFVTVSRGTIPPPGTSFGTTTFPEGVSMALHLDPATAGENVLHVDLVAPDGSPLAPGEVVVVATPADGPPVRFAPQTGEGRGTLAVPITLEAGTWTIDAVALTPDGRAFQADLFGVPIA
jgi:copper transport protein